MRPFPYYRLEIVRRGKQSASSGTYKVRVELEQPGKELKKAIEAVR